MSWKNNSKIASHWNYDQKKDKVVCVLCPRNCHLVEGQIGICGVRGNELKKLYTYNYGRGISSTIEKIETEAIYHYRPGAKILSIGNIGCNMSCPFCQNWSTSQIKYLNEQNVVKYTPDDIIELAISNGVDIISWTYNDPVVWHEFVVETSILAKKRGLKTLYKSAMNIQMKPLKELIEVIDLFSVSLKSMSDKLYREIMKGNLQPVLESIKMIYDSGKYIEISQLIVTGLNDDGRDAEATAKWILENLDPSVPLHFVAYHPAFHYYETRTPDQKLVEMRNIAISEGIKYCYVGNVFDSQINNTTCENCKNILVKRYGLDVEIAGVDDEGLCRKCNTKSTIIEPIDSEINDSNYDKIFEEKQQLKFIWDTVKNIHVALNFDRDSEPILRVRRIPDNGFEYHKMNHGIQRIMISKSSEHESGVEISINKSDVKMSILAVFDRAHYPTIIPD